MTRNPNEYEQRRHRVVAALEENQWNAIAVTAAPNIRYLSGFTGDNAVLVLSGKRALLLTDPRYAQQAAEETTCEVRVVRGPLPIAAGKVLRNFPVAAFEDQRISLAAHRQLCEQLDRRCLLEPAGSMLEEFRMVKSPQEVEHIRGAVLLNSEALAAALKRVRVGMTEQELATEIDFQMRRRGAEAAAFETIVASGARSALPHARPTACSILPNRLLLIDMGASRKGYASDMTRMAFPGRPARRVCSLYAAVRAAQEEAVAAVRPGVRAGAIDRVARRALRRQGLDRYFVHSTGHGLGLEIHERPRLARREKTVLQAGMVITVEPGIYLEGFGGIRVEDTVLVTEKGHEVLTPTPRELMII